MIKKSTVFIIVLLLSNLSGAAQNPANYRSEDIYSISRKLEKTARNRIWPGFELSRYTRLKTGDNGGYIHFSSDPDADPERNFSWRLDDEYFQNHALEENLLITFHEAFHAFERDQRRPGLAWGAENAMLVFEYQESSARNNALFRIEAMILRRALEEKKEFDLKKLVQEFISVRRLRQSELEPRFVEFEKGAELNEGLAEYAGTRAVVLGIETARQNKIGFADANETDFLRGKYARLDSITDLGRNIRLKFYYTGSAQGFLLDRLMPTDWKTKVQMEGKSLQGLLLTTAEKAKIPSPLIKYGYAKILAEEEKAVAARKAENQALLEKTLGAPGKKLTIDFSALNEGAGIRQFDPMNVTMISPQLRVHTRSVAFAANDIFSAEFSQPVIEDLEKKRYVAIIPENEIRSISADGEELSRTGATEKRFGRKLLIKTDNFTFEADGGGIVKISEKELIVLLGGG